LPNHDATATTINSVTSEPAATASAEGGAGATVMPTIVNPRATALKVHTPRFLPRDIGAHGRYNHRLTTTIRLSTVSANGMLCHKPEPIIRDCGPASGSSGA
jgi:hypothetical protein